MAGTTAGSTHELFDANIHKARKIMNLKTLVFWGHGDQFGFCGMKPDKAIEVIKDWKKHNSGLKTVELITCNARHCTSGDAFANSVRHGLHRGFMNSGRDITVKALPVAVGGKMNAFSILLAEPNFKSWAYITAPGTDDTEMQKVNKMMSFETTADGRSVSYRGDLAIKADKLAREHARRNWTLNYGYMSTLRACLVPVH